ncbi:MAG: amino acid adenylation domain-containing protein [Thermoanaerobaculia bacterium]
MSGTPTTGYRLSPLQRRLWRVLEPGEQALTRLELEVRGRLEPQTLLAAARQVAARHEALRTSYSLPAGFRVPFQVVAPEPAVAMNEHASSVQTGLGLRFEELGPAHFRLELSAPALGCDAESLATVAGELLHLAAGGGAEDLAPEPLQYVDFSEWQHEQLEQGDPALAVARSFWQEVELAPLQALSLPFELAARSAGGGRASERLQRRLEGEDLAAARELEARLGSRPGALALAVWLIWLEQRCRLAAPTTSIRLEGRNLPELEGAVGLFARWLPLVHRAPESLRFAELVSRVSKALGEAGGHQGGFAWPETEGEEPATPRVGFARLGLPAFSLPGLEARATGLESAPEGQALVLEVLESDEAWQLGFRFDPSRLLQEDVAMAAGEWLELLGQGLRRPDTPLGRLSLLGSEARSSLLQSWRGAGRSAEPRASLPEQIFAAAREVPDRVAVVFESEFLSYGALARGAEALAARLDGQGPESVVGLCLERSTELMAGLLGIWRAGAAYCPIDPAQPRERLRRLMEDLRAPAVVTSAELAPRLEAAGGRPVVIGEVSPSPAPLRKLAPEPSSLAYVIFTSGSTGRPKGVAVEHRQLAHYVAAARAALDLPAGASYASVSTLAADLGNTAIFPALASGGTLHLLSLERAADAEAFTGYFRERPVEGLKIVPSHLEAVLEADATAPLPWRRLVLGGEACRPEWAAALAGRMAGGRVFNHYGPTETTVGALTDPVGPSPGDSRLRAWPLGRPLEGMRAYLLDRRGEPLPLWAPGELFLAGDGVARGYLGRPAQTAERFLPDPLSPSPGARLYRTGDLARRLPDGRIEFLGRSDHQVKYHGFRIELAEIRAALNQHRAVRNSAIRLLKDDAGRDVLVAYYVAREELDPAELRTFLGEHIQEETLPGYFVHLRRLPLTLNGKVNLEALPELAEVRQKLARHFVAPTTETEKALAAIWGELLGLSRVGVEESFFELGGHSLLATRMASRIRRGFGVVLPLRALFEAPTIALLARRVEAERGTAAPAEVVLVAESLDIEAQLAELAGGKPEEVV